MIIIEIAGHLGTDPEVRFTPGGQKVTVLRLATNTRKSGKDETVWWRVTIWGERFDKMMPYIKKGSALIVIGEMGKPEIYTDKEGRPQVSLDLTAEMIRFSPFGKADRAGQEPSGQASYGQASTPSSYNSPSAYSEPSYTSQSTGNTGYSSYPGNQSSYKPAPNVPDDDNIPF
ncbi:single-stranded DNA-binding protein [Neochlamydia sp. S13]|uniref:single-stranded DNA-binding protein n=1 Tax=Neochlamydia sp. S13 TaxID=1353976 RepID=UPI0005AA6150|nr:single-stranded DNA-binding protein [Neochlamydia sp. S13]BBI16669.1 Single-stranded DNA-binding protein [Neochlamydia sp. S13]